MSCGVGRRRRSDPAMLWLWRRPAAVAPNRSLAWEPLYAVGAALKRQKDKKKNEKETLKQYLSMSQDEWELALLQPGRPQNPNFQECDKLSEVQASLPLRITPNELQHCPCSETFRRCPTPHTS